MGVKTEVEELRLYIKGKSLEERTDLRGGKGYDKN